MAHYGDRVKETVSTSGVGAYQLGGAASAKYSTFVDAIETAHGVSSPRSYSDCPYLCAQSDASGANIDYELARGTVTAGVGSAPDQMSRDSVILSSNGDELVDWGPGTKTIILCPHAADISGGTAMWSMTKTANQNFAGTATKITWETESVSRGNCTVDLLNNRAIVHQTGQWFVSFVAGLYPGEADIDTDLYIYVNGSAAKNIKTLDYDTGQNHGLGAGFLLDLIADDYVEIYGQRMSGSETQVMYYQESQGASTDYAAARFTGIFAE